MITVEDFRRLPERQDVQLELRAGRVVAVARPKKRQANCAWRILNWLYPIALPVGRLDREFTYRPQPEYELRVADLAYVPWARWEAVDDDDNLPGAPDFIAEIASSSHTFEDLSEKRTLCLQNGCTEFWIVDPYGKTVTVTAGHHQTTYSPGDVIPFTVFPNHAIPVDAIFTAHRG